MDILLSTHGTTAHAASLYSQSSCLVPWEPRGSRWESYDHVLLCAYTPSKWFRSRPSEGVRITRLCEIPRSLWEVPVGPRRCVRGRWMYASHHGPGMGQGRRTGVRGGGRFRQQFWQFISVRLKDRKWKTGGYENDTHHVTCLIHVPVTTSLV